MIKYLKAPLLLILAPLWLLGCDPSSSQLRDREFSDHDAEVKPFFTGSREFEPQPFQVPEIVRRREQVEPRPQAATEPFTIRSPKFVIDVDRGTMTFDLTVEAKGVTETLRLEGKFNKRSAPWEATLYAADQKILEERRVQAVALCLTPHVCDSLGINIYYKVDGKVYVRQLLTGVRGPRIPMSGDEDEPVAADESLPSPAEPVPVSPSQAGAPVVGPQPSLPLPPAPGTPSAAPAPVAPRQPPVLQRQTPPPAAPATPPSATPSAPAAPQPPPTSPTSSKKEEEVRAVAVPAVTAPASATKREKSLPIEGKTPEELDEQPIEYTGEMVIPPPEKSKYRIEGVEKLTPELKPSEIPQALGEHGAGYLRKADFLPAKGVGFHLRDGEYLQNKKVAEEQWRSWGTRRLRELIRDSAGKMAGLFPDLSLSVGDLARRNGGKLGSHLSHQTGLDVDIAYVLSRSIPSREPWPSVVSKGAVRPEFDLAKNWELLKTINQVRRDQVMVIFVHSAVKKAMCDYAKSIGEFSEEPDSLAFITLRGLVVQQDHYNHAHVRVYCPQTAGCTNSMVSTAKKTGCR